MTVLQALNRPLDTMSDSDLDRAREAIGEDKRKKRITCVNSMQYTSRMALLDWAPPPGKSLDFDPMISAYLRAMSDRIEEINREYFYRANMRAKAGRKAA